MVEINHNGTMHRRVTRPAKASRPRSAQSAMRGMSWRGWVDDIRVYYDVDAAKHLVIVLGIVLKGESAAWLAGPTARKRTGDDQ